MKNKFRIVLAITAVLITINASAQVKWGVKGGYNLSNFSFSGDVLDKSNQAGFYLGPTAKLALPLPGLSLDGSLLYSQSSAKVTVSEDGTRSNAVERKLKQKQLALPINLRYGFGLGNVANLFFFAGPQFAFDMSGDVKDINWEWKNTYMSINLGAGMTFAQHFQINLNYNIGCGHTGDATISSVTKQAFNGKANLVQVGFAYYF